jgi:hypothetical protein
MAISTVLTNDCFKRAIINNKYNSSALAASEKKSCVMRSDPLA